MCRPDGCCGRERRLWQEGRSLVFDDTWPHQVANETDEIRVVLFLDFARPLPRVVASINRAMIRLLGLTAFARRAVAFLNDPPAQPIEGRRGALD